MANSESLSAPEKPLALWRGFRGLCPSCGQGRLFKSYLVQTDNCPVCNESFADIHADDGPGWFVMVLTGAIVVPITIRLALHDVMPEWAALSLLVVVGNRDDASAAAAGEGGFHRHIVALKKTEGTRAAAGR